MSIPVDWRRALFVAEYVKDFRYGLAYKRAFPDAKNPQARGHRLLHHPETQKMIAIRLRHKLRAAGINEDRLRSELACIAFSNVGEMLDDAGQVMPVSQMREETQRAIQSLEVETTWDSRTLDDGAEQQRVSSIIVKPKLHDKMAALALLVKMEHLADDKVRHEVSGPGGGPVRFEDGRDKLAAALDALAAKIGDVPSGEAGTPAEGGAGRVAEGAGPERG